MSERFNLLDRTIKEFDYCIGEKSNNENQRFKNQLQLLPHSDDLNFIAAVELYKLFAKDLESISLLLIFSTSTFIVATVIAKPLPNESIIKALLFLLSASSMAFITFNIPRYFKYKKVVSLYEIFLSCDRRCKDIIEIDS